MQQEKQSGAVEACWAHNPEVRRSKLRSANFFIKKYMNMYFWSFIHAFCGHILHSPINKLLKNSTIRLGLMAQWITRLTTDQKIPGSNPGELEMNF